MLTLSNSTVSKKKDPVPVMLDTNMKLFASVLRNLAHFVVLFVLQRTYTGSSVGKLKIRCTGIADICLRIYCLLDNVLFRPVKVRTVSLSVMHESEF